MRGLMLVVVVIMAGEATAAPVPKALKKPRRAVIQPLPGDKLISVDWTDVPFATVSENLERLTGLMFLSREMPKVRVTLKAERVCMPELFALLDEVLYPQGWIVCGKSQSFAVYEAETVLERKAVPYVKLADLDRKTAHEPLQVVIETDAAGVEAGRELGAKKGSGVQVFELTDKLVTMGNGESLRAFVAGMGDHIKK